VRGSLPWKIIVNVDDSPPPSYLSGNRITAVPENLFLIPNRIRLIYLTSNPIKALKPGTFRNVPELELMFKPHTHLGPLPPNLFEHNPDLRAVALGHGAYANLDEQMLQGFRNLETFVFGSASATVFPRLSNSPRVENLYEPDYDPSPMM
jgi:hypothetical protein